MRSALLTVAVAALALAGCGQSSTTTDPTNASVSGPSTTISADATDASSAPQSSETQTELEPTPTEQPTSSEPNAVISAGTYLVPDEVPRGTYRVFGYWATLDQDMEIIENDGVYDEGELSLAVVGSNATYVEFSKEALPVDELPSYPVLELNPTAGTYLVGPDIAPGRYRVSNDGYAYAARLDDTLDIIDNQGNEGSVIIVIQPTDFAVQFSGTISPL